ncbi:hypothetical protein AVEN_100871-1 [Araneus ventricosus]|uniref:Uncharacterized protein n=1 Tax=Araneus ventricosus TaxID=182803 RepID=A0A4Y2AXT7_ARAVE|nr:hypothetical protein AVEN_100871-1 [Araneus ventricosus]
MGGNLAPKDLACTRPDYTAVLGRNGFRAWDSLAPMSTPYHQATTVPRLLGRRFNPPAPRSSPYHQSTTLPRDEI